MDSPILTLGPAAAPTHRPDLRPTADAAAIARETAPKLPFAIPATQLLSGAVNEARMADPSTRAADGDKPVERVLKPFGVMMLPDAPPEADGTGTPDDPEADADTGEETEDT